MDHLDDEQLRQGRQFLWAALAGALLSLPLMLTGKGAAFGLLCWVVAFVGGGAGISRVAEALGTGRLVKILGMVLAMMPTLNIVPIGYFLYRATKGGQDEEVVQEVLPSRPAVRPPRPQPAPAAQPIRCPAAAPSSTNPMRERIGRAIAHVKAAGLPNLPNGQRLQAKVKTPEGIQLSEDDEPVVLAMKGVFGVVYVIDEGQGLSYVNLGQVRAAGISLEELHRIGVDNLRALVDQSQRGLRVHALGNSHGLVLDGHFEASLVLVDELWDGPLKAYLPNGPVVAMPSRDVCAFCDAASADGIAELKGVSARVGEGGKHLISPQLFARKGENWVAFQGA
ncbi:MAG: hypothetical protein H6R10_1549 [Rhodocyclaceae bacterium]|nr:hypothetical protein [Rhodocyclaceae bacterium]